MSQFLTIVFTVSDSRVYFLHPTPTLSSFLSLTQPCLSQGRVRLPDLLQHYILGLSGECGCRAPRDVT